MQPDTEQLQARAIAHDAARRALRSLSRIAADDAGLLREVDDLAGVIDAWAKGKPVTPGEQGGAR